MAALVPPSLPEPNAEKQLESEVTAKGSPGGLSRLRKALWELFRTKSTVSSLENRCQSSRFRKSPAEMSPEEKEEWHQHLEEPLKSVKSYDI